MDIDKIINENQVIISDSHFVYTSGLHGDTYINKNIILNNNYLLKEVSKAMALLSKDIDLDYIIGPKTGGETISKEVSKIIKGSAVLSIDNINNPYVLREKKVLITEDVINTGISVKEVINKVTINGGRVTYIASIFNRGVLKSIDNIPIYHLKKIILKTYRASECPLCKEGIPINKKLGHG